MQPDYALVQLFQHIPPIESQGPALAPALVTRLSVTVITADGAVLETASLQHPSVVMLRTGVYRFRPNIDLLQPYARYTVTWEAHYGDGVRWVVSTPFTWQPLLKPIPGAALLWGQEYSGEYPGSGSVRLEQYEDVRRRRWEAITHCDAFGVWQALVPTGVIRILRQDRVETRRVPAGAQTYYAGDLEIVSFDEPSRLGYPAPNTMPRLFMPSGHYRTTP